MGQQKLKNLLEFKDREQIRGLLMLASGKNSDNEISDILLKFITDTKWSLLGLVDGPVLYALAGVKVFEAKKGDLQFFAVRPDHEKQGLGTELLSSVQKKLKLKTMLVNCPENVKGFFEKAGFVEVGSQKNDVDALLIEMKWEV